MIGNKEEGWLMNISIPSGFKDGIKGEGVKGVPLGDWEGGQELAPTERTTKWQLTEG